MTMPSRASCPKCGIRCRESYHTCTGGMHYKYECGSVFDAKGNWIVRTPKCAPIGSIEPGARPAKENPVADAADYEPVHFLDEVPI